MVAASPPEPEPRSRANPPQAQASPPATPQRGQVIDRRYRLLNLLGEGNSGRTYRAQRLDDGTIVALKALSLSGSQHWKLMELFEREVAILQQLDHPAIPRYVDSFVVECDRDRHFYLAQTLAEGQTLAAWVEGGWRCTEADAQDAAQQLLGILAYLQSRQPPVIHRDIKPQNIIRRRDGQLFLVDFGAVGHTYHNTFMRGSTVVGTFGYMAPEQFRGQACPATDLYSLGATLLYLLTRRSPADLPAQQLKVDFRSKVLLSDPFADWLGQLIEPSLGHRFSSAVTAQAALQSAQQQAQRNVSPLQPALQLLGGLTLVGLLALGLINQNKYSVLKHLGSTQELKAAIAAGDIPVREYLARGGELSLGGDDGQAILIFAVEQRDGDSLEQLLAQGLDPSQPNRAGDTALHSAARQEDSALLARLLELAPEIDLNGRDRQGERPIHVVTTPENALLLLGAGADPALLSRRGKSLLQIAVEKSWHGVIYDYLQGTQGLPAAVPATPSLLAIAATQRDAKTVKMLVREGARFSRPDLLALPGEAFTLALYQEEQRNWFVTGLPRLDARDSEGRTLLHEAIAQRRWPLGQLLLAQGADIAIRDGNGRTAIALFDSVTGNVMQSAGYADTDDPLLQFYRALEQRKAELKARLEREQWAAERKQEEAERKQREEAWHKMQKQREKEWGR